MERQNNFIGIPMYNGIDLTDKQQQKASIQCLLLLVIIEQMKNALHVKHLLLTVKDRKESVFTRSGVPIVHK